MATAVAAPPTHRSDTPARPGQSAARNREADLLARYREQGDLRAREELISDLVPLAKRLAGRYRHSGESQDDLEQVACIGLIKAIDRYEPNVGPFVRYAIPNVLGELRRHFRDKGWGMHVPRTVQENFLKVNEVTEQLLGELGRTPSVRDIAAASGMSLEDVIEAIDAGRSYNPAALDAPQPGADDGDGSRVLGDTLSSKEQGYDYVEIGQAIGPAFRILPEREQRIVYMRFFEDLTQSEIAAQIGISQMHVSRLLRRAIERLSAAVDETPDAA
jgi:RNA polymerase sigma-B factor